MQPAGLMPDWLPKSYSQLYIKMAIVQILRKIRSFCGLLRCEKATHFYREVGFRLSGRKNLRFGRLLGVVAIDQVVLDPQQLVESAECAGLKLSGQA